MNTAATPPWSGSPTRPVPNATPTCKRWTAGIAITRPSPASRPTIRRSGRGGKTQAVSATPGPSTSPTRPTSTLDAKLRGVSPERASSPWLAENRKQAAVLAEQGCAHRHKTDVQGRYMRPISYQDNCAACHPLLPTFLPADVQPAATARTFLETPLHHPGPGETAAVGSRRTARPIQPPGPLCAGAPWRRRSTWTRGPFS